MGWGSAGGYFDAVADALIEGGASDAVKTKVCSTLIGVFRDGDWDTHRDSLEKYAGDPAIVQAFREHDIVLTCWNEDRSDGHWHECTLERLHPGDHGDGMRSWPRTQGTPDA